MKNKRFMPRNELKMYAWSKPYEDEDIINIDTGCKKQFRYSPIFKNCIADTRIELTGCRRKDYIIAEHKTGVKHTPCITVWHHAWEEENGLYRMQLVDFEKHKKTCPHVGGCKLWLLKKKNKLKYAVYNKHDMETNYCDVVEFYPIENSRKNYFEKGYLSKRTFSIIGRKGLKFVGVDMYGNLYYENRNKQIYFWDHEQDCLFKVREDYRWE